MSLAADVYHELTLVGLAPPVHFAAADSKWRDAINKAIGDADDLSDQLEELEAKTERIAESRSALREQVRALELCLKNMTNERDRLAKQQNQGAVSA